MRVEKTVFICYRRTNIFHARALHLALTQRGYDVFLDFESIDSGAFERVILNQIDARAHFLILLTPSALERCTKSGDWVRREIEHAIEMKRNIVPLMFESFDFRHHTDALTGPLALLPQYNGLRVPADYFDEAIDRLSSRFLNTPLDLVLHPTPPADRKIIAQKQAEAATAPTLVPAQLSSEQYFESGLAHYNNGNFERAIADYTEVLCIKPYYTYAYYNRGLARKAQGNLDAAIADYTEAIRINPELAQAYVSRGYARYDQGNLDAAITDYTETIRINPRYAFAYYNRGVARYDQGNLDAATADYTEAIRIDPQYALAYYNRGLVRADQGDLDAAIADYTEAIRIKPDYANAHCSRGNARADQGDLDGAIDDYNAALRIDPEHKLARHNLKITRVERTIKRYLPWR